MAHLCRELWSFLQKEGQNKVSVDGNDDKSQNADIFDKHTCSFRNCLPKKTHYNTTWKSTSQHKFKHWQSNSKKLKGMNNTPSTITNFYICGSLQWQQQNFIPLARVGYIDHITPMCSMNRLPHANSNICNVGLNSGLCCSRWSFFLNNLNALVPYANASSSYDFDSC